MEEMDDLYVKLQVYLMKKNDECGSLRFLTSRTTEENLKHIEEICDSIGEIIDSCGIPKGEDNEPRNEARSVQAFKYLALNTLFDSQEHLTEDPLNGHLVDMAPPLSPYLLVEILWSLRYEEIVAESILHVPLDLAVELIDISQRCLHLLDFSRGLNFLSLLTLNCYKKLRLIDKNGALTMRLDENLERLMIHCQELMILFFDEKFTRFKELSDIQKSERHGLILKNILKLAKDCLHCSKNGVDLLPEVANMYKITFGREPYKRTNENFVTQLGMLDQEFVHILLKKLTDIAVMTYVDWASLEDSGNTGMTLQKSLGIDCYDFIEFTKNCDNLIRLENLVQCLQQIASKPETPEAACSKLDLEELTKGVVDGKEKCLKELMKRYREWNHEIFEVVRKHRSSLDKDDFFHLLEYLTYVMTKDGQEEHKRNVYTTVTRVLLQLNIKDVYETIVDYILKRDARNTLESSNTEDAFKKFMSHNKNFKSSTNLRLVLFFLVKNPRKILSILLKMAIGQGDYTNIVVPSDIVLLSPIMNIREKHDETLILVTLRQICTENEEWHTKKFSHLVRVMLEECVISVDDAINKVLIPCLEEEKTNLNNTRSLLNCLREILPTCTEKTNFDVLLSTIIRKMSRVRKDLRIRKYTIGQILCIAIRIIDITIGKIGNYFPKEKRTDLIEKLEKILSPIDRHHFSKLLSRSMGTIDLFDTIRDYERRCFTAITKIRDRREKNENDEENEIFDFQSTRFRNDYIRHVIVESIQSEYLKFGIEMTILKWDLFDFQNEYVAYDKFVSSTMEACIFSLEFPDSHSPDNLAHFLKNLVCFTRKLTAVEQIRDLEKIYKSLTENFRRLDKSIKGTIFSSHYTNVSVVVNNHNPREPINEKLQDLVTLIDKFGDKCLEIPHSEINFSGEISEEAKRYKIAHDFINEITNLDCVVDNNSSLYAIYKFLYSQESNN